MEYKIRHILFLYLLILLAGALFFIPAVFVNRFSTASALWIQMGISIGIIGYFLLAKERIILPPINFILLIAIWGLYHIFQNHGNIEKVITFITLVTTFFLFYFIWGYLQNKMLLFNLLSFLGVILSLWSMGQFFGLLPSYNTSFTITGPFDNPAGISVSLAVLLPFSLYCFRYSEKRFRLFAFITTSLVISVIILSKARTAIFSGVIILIFFSVYRLKERNIKIYPIHYTVIFVVSLLLLTGLFFIKKDSANGRLLIWKCSTQLISRSPVLGYGGNGFNANYMNEQASYFTKHPDSKYQMIADNVRHPFNEILKWIVNYGIIGLCLTLLLIVIPLWTSRKNDSPELFFIQLSFLSIGVCILFSYPFNYPFIRLMAVALLAFALAANPQKNTTITNGYLSKVIALLFSMGLLCATAYQFFYEHEWHQVANKSLSGQTTQMLPKYKSLYTHLRHKDLFLYNYAAELNVVGYYDKSLQIAHECDSLWADYDLQLLMADNYLQLQQYKEAERYLKDAAAMCPVKFMPLYLLVELYLETGRKEEARILAQKILVKEVKIPSLIISSINNKMQNLLTNNTNNLNESP